MDSQDPDDVTLAEEMRLLKMEALEKADLTDVSFLVGPEGEAELMHCFKSDLLVASEYFRGLFRSPLAGPLPIRMKQVQPHIFKLLLKHISTNIVEKPLRVEDAVDLAHAADEFLLDAFKSHYLAEIKKMASCHSNVWTILNRSKIPEVKSLCNKVLSSETKGCLVNKYFLGASQESLLHLLQLNELNIGSETELIDACFKLAKTKPEEERDAMIKAALPHLRLLTVNLYEIPSALLNYLTDSEKAHLLTMSITKLNEKKPGNAVGNLCPISEPRTMVAQCLVKKSKPNRKNYNSDWYRY